jgi:hypothetical protein
MSQCGWWYWVWRLFAWWSRLDIDPRPLPAKERWAIVAVAMPAAVRAFYLRPARGWLLARLPKWVVLLRLERSAHHWYRISSRGAADHVRLRFDIYPLDVDDLVCVRGGKLSAIAYAGANFFEMLFLLPNGEIEPDPNSPLMKAAWSAYWAAHKAKEVRTDGR